MNDVITCDVIGDSDTGRQTDRRTQRHILGDDNMLLFSVALMSALAVQYTGASLFTASQSAY